MKKSTFFSLIIFIVITSLIASAQVDEPSKSSSWNQKALQGVPLPIQTSCAEFFKTLIASNIERAFDNVLKNSPIAKKEDQVHNLIKETKRSIELYGQLKGYEPVNSEIVSESLIRIRYLALHSDFAMRWIFTYYQSPTRGWIIVNIKFDDLTEYYFKNE